jgi:small nuclear ribonucleoprotein D1
MNLFFFLKKILNETVTIELKNGVIIHGILSKFDKSMNLYLRHVKKCLSKSKSIYFESISIRGSMVRYIILPDWLNLDLILTENA